MYLVTQITSAGNQTQTITLPDSSIITLDLFFSPQQYGWFCNITYGDFVLLKLRITASPNMLRQWKNIVPFGLGCNTLLFREPTQQNDFQSQAFSLFFLSAEEVQAYEDYLSAGAPN